jgi:hypothetical protein
MTQPTMRSTQLVIAMPDIFEWLEERIYGSECSITDATAGKLPPNQHPRFVEDRAGVGIFEGVSGRLLRRLRGM